MPLGSLWGPSVSPIQESATSHRIVSVCCERGREEGGGRREEGSGPGGVSPIKRATLPPPGSNFVPH